MNEGEKVGYGRPPVATRFKPGMSGNPSGKRKAKPSLSQRLDRILAESVSVTEGGRSKRMTASATDEVLMSELVSLLGTEKTE